MRCAIARRAGERDIARLSERFARIHFLHRGRGANLARAAAKRASLGAPLQPELGIGAIAEGPAVHFNQEVCARLGLSERDVTDVVGGETEEIRRARR